MTEIAWFGRGVYLTRAESLTKTASGIVVDHPLEVVIEGQGRFNGSKPEMRMSERCRR